MLISSLYFYIRRRAIPWVNWYWTVIVIVIIIIIIIINPKTAFFLFCTKKIDPYPAFYWDPSLQNITFLMVCPSITCKLECYSWSYIGSHQPSCLRDHGSRSSVSRSRGRFDLTMGSEAAIVIVAHDYSKFILPVEAIAYRKIPKISPSMYKPLQI